MTSHQQTARYFRISIIWLIVATSMGLALRYAFIGSTGFHFQNLLHAHSHVGILGWLFSAQVVFFEAFYFRDAKYQKGFSRWFWAIQFTVAGMALSFPFQGYGSVSIPLSALHMFLTYGYIFNRWKKSKSSKSPGISTFRMAMMLSVVSSIGVWFLGPVMVFLGRETPFYDAAIQWFLHFQFNGWIVLGILSILFNDFSFNRITKRAHFSVEHLVFILAIFGSATLSLPTELQYLPLRIIGLIASGVQMVIFLIWFKGFQFLKWDKSDLLRFSIAALGLKMMLQAVFSLAIATELIDINRNMIIGFIHLLLLGVATVFYIERSQRYGYYPNGKFHIFLWNIFALAIVITEVLLFLLALKPLGWLKLIPNTSDLYHALFFASALLPLTALFSAVFYHHDKGHFRLGSEP